MQVKLKINTAVLMLILFIVFNFVSRSHAAITWEKTYGGNGYEGDFQSNKQQRSGMSLLPRLDLSEVECMFLKTLTKARIPAKIIKTHDEKDI